MRLMQVCQARYPQIGAVWANGDDRLRSLPDAVKPWDRTQCKYALGGNRMKDVVKMVMELDAMTPILTPSPPPAQFYYPDSPF